MRLVWATGVMRAQGAGSGDAVGLRRGPPLVCARAAARPARATDAHCLACCARRRASRLALQRARTCDGRSSVIRPRACMRLSRPPPQPPPHLLQLLLQPHVLLLAGVKRLTRAVAGERDVLEHARHLDSVVQVGPGVVICHRCKAGGAWWRGGGGVHTVVVKALELTTRRRRRSCNVSGTSPQTPGGAARASYQGGARVDSTATRPVRVPLSRDLSVGTG